MELLDYESTRKALRVCLGDKGCAGCPLKGNSKCTIILHKSSYKHLKELKIKLEECEDREIFQEANDY
jgi:hypothetical protein